MNKYLVEDEYSFYEIDPECIIGPSTVEKSNISLKQMEKRRSRGTDGSFCSLVVFLILFWKRNNI